MSVIETPLPIRGRLGRSLATTALIALVVLAALMLVPFGYQRYVVDGGSMGTAIPRGSLIFDEVVPTRTLRVGDVITYVPPRLHHLVTHRIVSIGPGGALRTKGDANRAADPWTFKLTAASQARVAFHVPAVGYAYAALGVRTVRRVVIGLPALLVAAGSLAGLRRGRQ